MVPLLIDCNSRLSRLVLLSLAAWSSGLVGPMVHAQTERMGRGGNRPHNSRFISDDEPTVRRSPLGESRTLRDGVIQRMIREDAFETEGSQHSSRWDVPLFNRDQANVDGFGLVSPESRDGLGLRRRGGGLLPRTSPEDVEQTFEGLSSSSEDNAQPIGGSQAWRGHLAPAQELITRRYSDPQFQEFLATVNPQQTLAIYQETLELIAARHLDPAPPTRLVQRGLFNLVEALRNSTFQQRARLVVDPRNLPVFETQLVQMFEEFPSRTPVEATQLLERVMQSAQQSLGLNPLLVALEFEFGAIESLDQFSAVVPPTQRSGPRGGLSAPVGIGVQVQVAPEGLRILRTLAASPAQQAGLQPQDLIVSVDGQSLAGRDLNSATGLITGPDGTQATLTVLRDGFAPAVIPITRQRLEARSVSEARMLNGETGYVRLDSFEATSAQEVQQALQSLANQGMRNLVFDLRGNPGGLLTTSIEIGRLFVRDGIVVSTRGRTAEDNTSEPGADGATWNLPLAILVDSESASASEILAAAIQENNRGVIVGMPTYGKGTVQTLFPLKTAGVSLRLTTAKFYSPRGRAMAGEGVQPDIPVAGDATTQGTPSDPPLLQAITAVNQFNPETVPPPLVRGRGVRNLSRPFRAQTGQKYDIGTSAGRSSRIGNREGT